MAFPSRQHPPPPPSLPLPSHLQTKSKAVSSLGMKDGYGRGGRMGGRRGTRRMACPAPAFEKWGFCRRSNSGGRGAGWTGTLGSRPARAAPARARARCPRPPRRGTHGAAQPPTGRVMRDLRASSSLPRGASLFSRTLLPIASFHLSGPGPGVFKRIEAFVFLVGNHLGKAVSPPDPCPPFHRENRGEPVSRARSTGQGARSSKTLRICPGGKRRSSAPRL